MATPGEERPGKQSLNRGSNQVTVRSYNERLILQLVRKHGALTKAEAAQATGLSANAVSVIFRALEDAELLVRNEPLRGRRGQPSTPFYLNPAARHYFGLKIGRKSADLVLIDFLGKVLASHSVTYRYPVPSEIRGFVQTSTRLLLKQSRVPMKRVFGFGIAIPFEIWSWTDETDMPKDRMVEWDGLDLAGLLSPTIRCPIAMANDSTAACMAEHTFCETEEVEDSIYFYVGTLIGGGVVLNGSVFFGRTGNAGGFGPFRVPFGEVGANRLLDHASLVTLQKMLQEAGHGPQDLQSESNLWSDHSSVVQQWLDRAALALAHAIASSLSVVDFEAVIIDGSFPADVRAALVSKTESAFLAMDLQGLPVPKIRAGHCGSLARAIGAAALPLNASYSINQNTLLRR